MESNSEFETDLENNVRKKSLNNNRNYRYNAQISNHNSDRQKTLPIEIGKTIRLLRNGDPFYRGHKFVISSRRYRYFDVFMDAISETLNANFGAIRKIYSIDGQKINHLEELQDGETYVAGGLERFIRMKY